MKYWLFGLLVLTSIALPPFALAQDTGLVPVIPTPTPIPNYTLPYPGILPTNPLYPLKMARDKIILFLITDPVKRAQFNLLQADKRMEAAIFLVNQDKKNGKLAVMTIEKGENYYHDAVQQATSLQKEGRNVNDLLLNLDHAATKHIMLMTDLQKILPQESDELTQLKARMQSYQLQLQQIKH
jgi:hypothetical protein